MLGECHISFFILSSLYFYLTLSILGCYSDLGVSANLHISFYPPYVWVCGLKHNNIVYICHLLTVTPYMGVWIETVEASFSTPALKVTPCMGVWIETRPPNILWRGRIVTPCIITAKRKELPSKNEM